MTGWRDEAREGKGMVKRGEEGEEVSDGLGAVLTKSRQVIVWERGGEVL